MKVVITTCCYNCLVRASSEEKHPLRIKILEYEEMLVKTCFSCQRACPEWEIKIYDPVLQLGAYGLGRKEHTENPLTTWYRANGSDGKLLAESSDLAEVKFLCLDELDVVYQKRETFVEPFDWEDLP